MNLSNGDNAHKFRQMLDKCERASTSTYRLTDWETTFIADMVAKFEFREEQVDLGITPWSPTMNQWNTLHGIASKL